MLLPLWFRLGLGRLSLRPLQPPRQPGLCRTGEVVGVAPHRRDRELYTQSGQNASHVCDGCPPWLRVVSRRHQKSVRSLPQFGAAELEAGQRHVSGNPLAPDKQRDVARSQRGPWRRQAMGSSWAFVPQAQLSKRVRDLSSRPQLLRGDFHRPGTQLHRAVRLRNGNR